MGMGERDVVRLLLAINFAATLLHCRFLLPRFCFHYIAKGVEAGSKKKNVHPQLVPLVSHAMHRRDFINPSIKDLQWVHEQRVHRTAGMQVKHGWSRNRESFLLQIMRRIMELRLLTARCLLYIRLRNGLWPTATVLRSLFSVVLGLLEKLVHCAGCWENRSCCIPNFY